MWIMKRLIPAQMFNIWEGAYLGMTQLENCLKFWCDAATQVYTVQAKYSVDNPSSTNLLHP